MEKDRQDFLSKSNLRIYKNLDYMLQLDEITFKIIGCAMKVHNTVGCGFQEIIYQRCLAIEMKNAGLGFEREKSRLFITIKWK